MLCFSNSIGQCEWESLCSVEDVHCSIVGVSFSKEIIAEVLCRYGVPEAGGCECIVGVHFVLNVSLIIIYLLQIINDFYIALN
jgi:hypothetical protein